MLCIKLVDYWDKYTEMHGQQNVKTVSQALNELNVHKRVAWLCEDKYLETSFLQLKSKKFCPAPQKLLSSQYKITTNIGTFTMWRWHKTLLTGVVSTQASKHNKRIVTSHSTLSVEQIVPFLTVWPIEFAKYTMEMCDRKREKCFYSTMLSIGKVILWRRNTEIMGRTVRYMVLRAGFYRLSIMLPLRLYTSCWLPTLRIKANEKVACTDMEEAIKFNGHRKSDSQYWHVNISRVKWVQFCTVIIADPNDRAVWGLSLRPLTCWDCEFETRWVAWMRVSCECCVVK